MNRNGPCFCGSGRKYKRCHGASAAADTNDLGAASLTRRSEIARASALKQLDVEVREQLLGYARRRFGRTFLDDAIRDFSGDSVEPPTEDEYSLLMPWMLYHMAASDAERRPVADIWREEHRLYREPAKDRLVQAHLEAPIGIWEVQSIEPGVGSQLTDLLSGEERFVYDASSTAMLNPWLGLLAFVVDCDGVSFFGGIHTRPLPPEETSQVVRAVRKLARVRSRPVSLAFRSSPDMQAEIVGGWRYALHELSHRFDHVVMHNTDGHVMAPQTDRFELRADRRVVLAHLASVKGAEPPERIDEDDVIVVTQPRSPSDGMPGDTVVGRLIVSPSRLTIETNSVERADMLRGAAEVAAGDSIRFQLRLSAPLDAASLQERDRRGSKLPHVESQTDAPPEEVQEILRQFYLQHTATWSDIALPVLDGMTPRAAAKSAAMRPRLETLLKDIEQREMASPPGLRMDVRAIRRALGL